MLSLPNIPQSGVFPAVVVGIDFVPTLQTLELLAVAVILVGEATVSVRTPLARVIWFDLFNCHTVFWCFVLDALDKTAEGPHMMPVSLRQSLTDIGQVLEHDYVAVMCNGFVHYLVGNRVDVLFVPCSFSFPESKQGVVSGLCPTLLHLCAAFFQTPVSSGRTRHPPERAC